MIVGCALFMEMLDCDGHLDRAARDGQVAARGSDQAQSRDHLLPAEPRRLHSDQRLDGRPIRRAHRLPHRDRDLHHRLGVLRMSQSLPELVAARILQGFGGAMMVPVGRLIVLKTIAKSDLVTAMSYLTVPAVLGPVVGPPVGGFIVTYYSWRWIFFINVPIGVIGIMLVTLVHPEHPRG